MKMTQNKKKELVKNNGQIFTPDYLVNNILDFAGYRGTDILKKHIIDNSCGAGAFLTQITKRYCEESISYGLSKEEIKRDLEYYLHGIELEDEAYNNVLINLNNIVQSYNIVNVNWDIKHTDALSVTCYNNKMDYVVGNPPYVRVHNLNDSYNDVKSFSFAIGGMTDLYLVFYELGFRMLNDSGKLCYITPSSWLTSVAGKNMRDYIHINKNLIALIDLEHFQPFEATAYTMIALFQKNIRQDTFSYFTYNGEMHSSEFICELSISEVSILGSFYLSTSKKLERLKEIKTSKVKKLVSVKNGFATLADKVFIGNVPETKITIPIIKASTGKWSKCLFPYKFDGSPIPEDVLNEDLTISQYYKEHKEELTKGKSDMIGWMYYGRTQALKDVVKTKYAINSIIKDVHSIKINLVPAKSGVYSGLYILTDVPEDILKTILISQDFIDYIKTLKSYKSGGYYTYNSKDLEQFINYKLNEIKYENTSNPNTAYQCGLFEGSIEFL